MPKVRPLAAAVAAAVVAATFLASAAAAATTTPDTTPDTAAKRKYAAEAEKAPALGTWLPWWRWELQNNSPTHASISSLDAFSAEVRVAGEAIDITLQGKLESWEEARDTWAKQATTWLSFTDESGAGELSQLISTPQGRRTLARQMVQQTLDMEVQGIDVDFEVFAFKDGPNTWPQTRERWVNFIRTLSNAAKKQQLLLAVTTPAIYNSNRDAQSGYWVYSWAEIANHVNKLRIMLYDYSWNTPGPIGPLDWAERTLKYATTVVPARKIELGVAAYGRNWVTGIDGTCPQEANLSRTVLSMQDGYNVAKIRGAQVRFDNATGEATFKYSVTYTEGELQCTVQREAWFPTWRSLHQRILLASRLKLSGVHIWEAGYISPIAWTRLEKLAQNGVLAKPKPRT